MLQSLRNLTVQIIKYPAHSLKISSLAISPLKTRWTQYLPLKQT